MSNTLTSEAVVSSCFFQIWREAAPRSALEAWYERIRAHYSEPSRFYHTFDHIAQGLTVYQKRVWRFAKHSRDFETAYILHDVIYDTQRTDNEKRSAEFATEMLSYFGDDMEMIGRVRAYIMATKHDRAPQNPDEQLIADLDLVGFAGSYLESVENARKIRREYAWVPAQQFVEERRKILNRILDGGIYHTPHFKSKYYDAARENILREISELPGIIAQVS